MRNYENKRMEHLKWEWEEAEAAVKQWEQKVQENCERDLQWYSEPDLYHPDTCDLIDRAAVAKETAKRAKLNYQTALQQQKEKQKAVADDWADELIEQLLQRDSNEHS